jgi:hypothetical protein
MCRIGPRAGPDPATSPPLYGRPNDLFGGAPFSLPVAGRRRYGFSRVRRQGASPLISRTTLRPKP